MIVHGGDVWQVGDELGIAPEELLDFSANVNPRGLPQRAQEQLIRDASNPKLLSLYPDPAAHRLRKALSEHLDVPADAIVIGPGAESLLTPVLRCVRPQRALVPVPAFSEYRRVCEQQQIEFVPLPLQWPDSFHASVDDVVLLNNPHNPSGALLERPEIKRILESGRSNGATLLLDEAFIDYAPQATFVREAAAQPGLIVIRSLTKFYGCPALRVGYAVAHPATARRIQSLLPTWPVTQLAIDALAAAVSDREYAETSLSENAAARKRLSESLEELGLVVFPSAANYLLIELRPGTPPSSELRSRLIAKHRILIRNCDSYETLARGRFIRVAVRTLEENQRLIQALAEELKTP